MRRRDWRASALGGLLVLLLVGAPVGSLTAAPTQSKVPSARSELEKIDAALERLRLDVAEQSLAELPAPLAQRPEFMLARATLAYHRGDYRGATEVSAQVVSAGKDHPDLPRWRAMHELFAATHELTAGYQELTSPDGRYSVAYPPGKDALMAPYALEVLAAADAALERRLGVHVPGPIRLEIYPEAEVLAAVSGLTVEQIQTTGTVAISKWNRLMITSPKALVRGYPWADTISHELVHMVLSRATGEQAPVWFQEGTAKLLERSWRAVNNGVHLDAAAVQLLQDAAREDRLLTFAQMHPSIAMLPSQDDAALAFAQVATLMDQVVQKHGDGALRDAISRIESGQDAQKALAAAADTSFKALERSWRKAVGSYGGANAAAGARLLPMRFRKGKGKLDESEDVGSKEARDLMQIGDLLWDRGRTVAAALEYGKAHALDRYNPVLAARLARAALQARRPQQAYDALKDQAVQRPGHAPTHALLGAACLALGKLEEARAALKEAIHVNPFDPQPHCDLAQAALDEQERQQEQANCQALR